MRRIKLILEVIFTLPIASRRHRIARVPVQRINCDVDQFRMRDCEQDETASETGKNGADGVAYAFEKDKPHRSSRGEMLAQLEHRRSRQARRALGIQHDSGQACNFENRCLRQALSQVGGSQKNETFLPSRKERDL